MDCSFAPHPAALHAECMVSRARWCVVEPHERDKRRVVSDLSSGIRLLASSARHVFWSLRSR
jgi:hypothetical protein